MADTGGRRPRPQPPAALAAAVLKRTASSSSLASDKAGPSGSGRIPLVDLWERSPIELFLRYRKIPARLTLHLVLAVLVAAQAMLLMTVTTKSSLRSHQSFIHYLWPAEHATYEGNPLSYTDYEFVVFTKPQLQATLTQMLQGYFDVTGLQSSVQGGHLQSVPELDIVYQNFSVSTWRVPSAEDVPYYSSTIANMSSSISSMTLALKIATALPSQVYITGSACVLWTIAIRFDFSNLGEAEVSMSQASAGCPNEAWSFTAFHGICITILVVVCLHQIAILRDVWSSLVMTWTLRRKAASMKRVPPPPRESSSRQRPALVRHVQEVMSPLDTACMQGMPEGRRRSSSLGSWSMSESSHADSYTRPLFADAESMFRSGPPVPQVPADKQEDDRMLLRRVLKDLQVSDTLELWSIWHFLSTVGHVCLILYNARVLYHPVNARHGTTLLAVGCFMDWLALLQWFKYHRRQYLVVLTISRGVPHVAKFLLGAIPVYAGYVVYAVTVLSGYTHRFSGIDNASITLFALMNGDVVRESFQCTIIYQTGWWLRLIAQVYLYLFIGMFVYVFLKACIAIMEESYLCSRPSVDAAEGDPEDLEKPHAHELFELFHGYQELQYRLPKLVRGAMILLDKTRQRPKYL